MFKEVNHVSLFLAFFKALIFYVNSVFNFWLIIFSNVSLLIFSFSLFYLPFLSIIKKENDLFLKEKTELTMEWFILWKH